MFLKRPPGLTAMLLLFTLYRLQPLTWNLVGWCTTPWNKLQFTFLMFSMIWVCLGCCHYLNVFFTDWFQWFKIWYTYAWCWRQVASFSSSWKTNSLCFVCIKQKAQNFGNLLQIVSWMYILFQLLMKDSPLIIYFKIVSFIVSCFIQKLYRLSN